MSNFSYLSVAHLFSLMVGLTHFDVCDHITTRASVQDVRHRGHQVIQRSSLRLFSST